MKRPEFSRLVPLARLERGAVREAIEAGPAEREALARRFGLLALDRLSAEIELRREKAGVIALQARYETAFAQNCVRCLEPVSGSVADRFTLRYGAASEPGRPLSIDPEEEVFEPLSGAAIDVGEAVAQELSLALPAFPRHPDGVVEESAAGDRQESAAASEVSPFAVLKKLPSTKKN